MRRAQSMFSLDDPQDPGMNALPARFNDDTEIDTKVIKPSEIV